jgi:hypothetical protein
MSAILSAGFQPIEVQERLPEALAIPTSSAASVVVDRRRVRYVPSTTQSYTQSGPNQINIFLSSQSDYMDLHSATLNGKLKIDTLGTGTYVALGDHIASLFQRARLYVGGTLVEDRNNLGVSVNQEVYTSVPYGHYESAGPMESLMYKFNKTNFADGKLATGVFTEASVNAALASMAKNQPTARMPQVYAWQTSDGASFSVPLAYIFGMFRSMNYFPLRNSGVVQISIDIAPTAQAFVSDSASSTFNWTLSNVEVKADMVTCDPRYVAVVDSLCSDASLGGYKLPINTFQVLNSQISAGSAQRTILLSKATRNAKQVLIAFQDQTQTLATRSTDRFNANGFVQAYLQCGSARFPLDPTSSYGEAYGYTLDAQHLLGNVIANPVMDVENYQNLVFSPVSIALAADAQAQCWIWGASLERLRNEYVTEDGLNTSASGGGNLQYYITSAPAADQTMIASIEFGEVVHIQANRVAVI